MSLDARLRLERGAVTIDAAIATDTGRVIALLGPNGAGKSSIVEALAGLLQIDAGHVYVDGDVWVDTDRAVDVPARGRDVGVMFQGLRLLPWLDALDNVAYPLRRRGVKKHEARKKAAGMLAAVGLERQARIKPNDLSGGEAQRVAVARALVVEPALLLLDEPLSDVDVTARGEIRHLLRDHLKSFGGTTVLVTHDHLDAAALADEVVVLENGHVTQSGSFEDLAARPRSRYVADLRGTNLYEGRGSARSVEIGAITLTVGDDAPRDAFVAIDPRAVALHLDEPKGSPRNAWLLQIARIEPTHRAMRVSMTGPLDLVAEVTEESVNELGLAAGDNVWATVKATEISVYPA